MSTDFDVLLSDVQGDYGQAVDAFNNWLKSVPEEVLRTGEMTQVGEPLGRAFGDEASGIRFLYAASAAYAVNEVLEQVAEHARRQRAESDSKARQAWVFRLMRLFAETESLQALMLDVLQVLASGDKGSHLEARVAGVLHTAQQLVSDVSQFASLAAARGEDAALGSIFDLWTRRSQQLKALALGRGDFAVHYQISAHIGVH